MDLNEAVITRRRRVPLPEPVPGDGVVIARQLDAALASAGFKLSRDLFEDLAAREAGQVLDIGITVLSAARKLAGEGKRVLFASWSEGSVNGPASDEPVALEIIKPSARSRVPRRHGRRLLRLRRRWLARSVSRQWLET